MSKKFFIGIGAGFFLGATVFIGYVLWNMNPQDRCDLFHLDSSYTLETWQSVQFHLPVCWKMLEVSTEELIIGPASSYPAGSANEFLSVFLYTSFDLSNSQLISTFKVGDQEFDVYQKDASEIYVPRHFQQSIYFVFYPKFLTNYDLDSRFSIILGSIQDNLNDVVPVVQPVTQVEPTVDTLVETDEGEEPLISITSPDDRAVFDFSMVPIEFTGQLAEGVKKIIVTADYTSMDIETDIAQEKQDVYELQSFHLGDRSFVYRANTEWNNLGMGENHYTFTAYFLDGTSVSVERNLCMQFEVFYPPSCWQN